MIIGMLSTKDGGNELVVDDAQTSKDPHVYTSYVTILEAAEI